MTYDGEYIVYTGELALLSVFPRLFFPLYWAIFRQSVWEMFPPAPLQLLLLVWAEPDEPTD